MSTVPSTPAKIVYPEIDGRPMAESDIHRDWLLCSVERLKRRYAGQRVYVSGNLLIYYEEGNPRRSVAPDVFVVKDCDPRRRRIFKIWEEKRTPNWVMETTSFSTQNEDLEGKMDLYALLRVGEYFLYDPLGEWLSPALIGYRLSGGDYEPIPREKDGSLYSAELDVYLYLDHGRLQMRDARTGELLASGEEQAEQLQKENEGLKARLAAMEEQMRRMQTDPGKP